jgi:hypothetical protein
MSIRVGFRFHAGEENLRNNNRMLGFVVVPDRMREDARPPRSVS